MMKTGLLSIALVAALFTAGLNPALAMGDNPGKRYTFEDSYESDLGGVERMTLEIVNGSVQVETWDGDRIEIEMTERIRHNSREEAQEIAEKVEFRADRAKSRLFLELDYNGLGKKDRSRYSVNLLVKIPARLSVGLETTNGSISVERLHGDIRVATTNGSVEVAACGGDAKVTTTNGSIAIGQVNGELIAHTTNGDIKIAGARGDIKGNTTNGGITLLVAEHDGFEIVAKTTNGKIKERVPGLAGDFNKRKTKMTGAYGDGSHQITLHTTNGSVTIEEI